MGQAQTSFERFMRNRGISFLSSSQPSRVNLVAQLSIGVVCCVIGAALLIIGLLMDGSPHAAGLCFSSSGPFLAGIINIVVSLIFQKRTATNPPAILISGEAKRFLTQTARQMMGRQFDWYQPEANGGGSQFFLAPLKIKHSPEEVLPPGLFDLLEQASYQYNRTFGILQSAASSVSGQKLGPTFQVAADEAMISILHQSAIIEQFPESSSNAIRATEAQIDALTELADRLEDLQTRAPSIADRLGPTSTMESVLDELRLGELARRELS